MFDIDGTLVDSFEFDEVCFIEAVATVLDSDIDTNWGSYPHVTDRGLLLAILRRRNRQAEIEQIEPLVKYHFLRLVKKHLSEHGLPATPGASGFIRLLRDRHDIQLSIATGGWRESALLKLAAAEIDVGGIPIATSNDHHIRTEIMQLAFGQAKSHKSQEPVVYFGDAEWDKHACAELGFNFVLVGNRTQHHLQISDFQSSAEIFNLLGIPVR